jgi:hypothetical protein
MWCLLFFLGLVAGMFITFAVIVLFQVIHFIMSEFWGLSVQPNNLETRRWYALVNAVMIVVSPLVLLSKNKKPWTKFFLSLVNIPFFLVVYWVVSSLWKPEVQVGLEIQLVMIISLTLGLHLLYWLAQAKKKSKIKKKRKKERKKAAKERE